MQAPSFKLTARMIFQETLEQLQKTLVAPAQIPSTVWGAHSQCTVLFLAVHSCESLPRTAFAWKRPTVVAYGQWLNDATNKWPAPFPQSEATLWCHLPCHIQARIFHRIRLRLNFSWADTLIQPYPTLPPHSLLCLPEHPNNKPPAQESDSVEPNLKQNVSKTNIINIIPTIHSKPSLQAFHNYHLTKSSHFCRVINHHYLVQRGFLGCRTFSSKTRKDSSKLENICHPIQASPLSDKLQLAKVDNVQSLKATQVRSRIPTQVCLSPKIMLVPTHQVATKCLHHSFQLCLLSKVFLFYECIVNRAKSKLLVLLYGLTDF